MGSSSRGYPRPSPRSPMGPSRSFGALKYASGTSTSYSKSGSRAFRPIPGRPSYPSFKPRGGYNYNPSYKPNRTQFSEQQLKDRSNISDREWNVCWEFNSKRGCRRGSACKWKHITFEGGSNVYHPVTKEALNVCPEVTPSQQPAGGPVASGAPDKTEQQQTQEQAESAQEAPKKKEHSAAILAANAAGIAKKPSASATTEK